MKLLTGDCRVRLKEIADNTYDSVVCDPPYGLSKEPDIAEVMRHWLNDDDYEHGGGGFMGRKWDSFVPGPSYWKEVFRVLKPGGHLVAFSGTRTYDLMSVAVRFAGFEVRDTIQWQYGSGFPKSLDVSKAVDKAGGLSPKKQSALLKRRRETRGLSREDVARHVGCTVSSVRDWEEGRARSSSSNIEWITPSAEYRAKLADLLGYSDDERVAIGVAKDRRGDGSTYGLGHSGSLTSGGHTPEAKQWSGWGTALKPAHEVVLVAQKPVDEVDIIRYTLNQFLGIEGKLWSLLPANAAKEIFQLSHQEHERASSSAQWSAEERNSTLADLSEVMDMRQLESAIAMSLNIVTSWRNTLVEASIQESTSTTKTESKTTIDWKTLRSCLSEITPLVIIRALTDRSGRMCSALHAVRTLDVLLRKLSAILELSALDRVISQVRISRRVAEGRKLTPNNQPILLARKPLEGTVAANVLEHGVGGLNIDACRIATSDGLGGGRLGGPTSMKTTCGSDGWDRPWMNDEALREYYASETRSKVEKAQELGRWPANVILTHHPDCVDTGDTAVVSGDKRKQTKKSKRAGFYTPGDAKSEGAPRGTLHGDQDVPIFDCHPDCPVRILDEQSGDRSSPWRGNPNGVGKKGGQMFGGSDQSTDRKVDYGDSGGASRFFYHAKTSKKERNLGCGDLYWKRVSKTELVQVTKDEWDTLPEKERAVGNTHPTVKPKDLMAYLIKLVTPPGGKVLDPFMGSGSTGVAAVENGFDFTGIELEEQSVVIAEARINASGIGIGPLPTKEENREPEREKEPKRKSKKATKKEPKQTSVLKMPWSK